MENFDFENLVEKRHKMQKHYDEMFEFSKPIQKAIREYANKVGWENLPKDKIKLCYEIEYSPDLEKFYGLKKDFKVAKLQMIGGLVIYLVNKSTEDVSDETK